tara:strand:- start:23639 stop:25408 length:1770 start_codon:yes stop_codon:yes gene_type:complete
MILLMKNKILHLISDKEKKKIFIIIIGLFFIALLEMISIGSIPAFVYLFLDLDRVHDVINQYNLNFKFIVNQNPSNLLIFSSVILIFIFLIKNITILFFNFYHFKFNYEIKKNLCLKFFSKYIDEDYEIIKTKSNSKITRDILIETSQFVDIIDNSIIFLREVLLLCGIIILLIIADPIITFTIGTSLGLILICFYLFFRKKITSKGKIVQFERERLFQWINQTIGSIIDIKIFNKKLFFFKLFSSSIKRYEKQNLYMNFISTLPRAILEIASVSMILLFMIIYILSNKDLTSFLPFLTLLVVALLKMIPSFNNLILAVNTLKFRKPSLDLIYENLANYKNPLEKIQKDKDLEIKEGLKIANVTYSYPDSKIEILKNINLDIKKGEFTAIIGKSGSGKTTLMLILLGLLQPKKGKILIDEKCVHSGLLNAWQSKISFVSQSPYLINDTIKSNITFGDTKNKKNIQLLELVCKISKIDEFIYKNKNGLESIVEDNGSNLSGGQKQRISIARALYKNSEFIFFDEATNALDEELEKEIFKLIHVYFPKKTIIVITHRLSSIKDADNIIYIEKGEYVDSGKYDFIKLKYIDV